MATDRTADVTWHGDLMSGNGRVESVTSGALGNLDVDWRARSEDAQSKTSPEELIAAAHAGCFSMALSKQLGDAGMTAESVNTTAAVRLEKTDAGFSITKVHLDVTARIPGADDAAFQTAADNAKAGCPVSRLLKAEITMDAKLEG